MLSFIHVLLLLPYHYSFNYLLLLFPLLSSLPEFYQIERFYIIKKGKKKKKKIGERVGTDDPSVHDSIERRKRPLSPLILRQESKVDLEYS